LRPAPGRQQPDIWVYTENGGAVAPRTGNPRHGQRTRSTCVRAEDRQSLACPPPRSSSGSQPSTCRN